MAPHASPPGAGEPESRDQLVGDIMKLDADSRRAQAEGRRPRRLEAIRLAALDYYAVQGAYPPSGNRRQVPATLAPSLPRGFQFQFAGADYRWRRYGLASGLPQNRSQTVLLGVEVRSTNAALLRSIRGLYRGNAVFGSSTQLTFVIE